MRIRQLQNNEIDTMIEAVAIRYRVKCDEINTILIRQTIQSEFKLYHLNDFNDAFIKHCSGKFMISKEAEGNKPYGDLSALFICDVLNGYKNYKAKNHKIKPIEDTSRLIEVKKMTKEENAKHWFDWVIAEMKANKKIPMMADWDSIFWLLTKDGSITLDNDSKEMFLESVRFDIQEEINFRKAEHKDYRNYTRMLESEDSLKRECRKRIVKKHLENLEK